MPVTKSAVRISGSTSPPLLPAPLKRMAPDLARHLAPGGVAILSGLLVAQARGVEAVYAGHGLRRQDRVELGEWVSLMLRKR